MLSDDLSMKATRGFGSMPERASLALRAGCDMVIICNDRGAAERAVASLNGYRDPLSMVRLARLHGTERVSREALLASERWQEASAAIQHWTEPPELELDA